jgi:hypothetical protein
MNDTTASGVYKVPGSANLKEARLGVTTVVAIISTAVGMGVTWGAYSNRLAEVERKADEAHTAAIQLAVLNSQYSEILRRLDRIERQGK